MKRNLVLSLLIAGTADASQIELLRCVQELKQIQSKENNRLELQAGLALGYGERYLLLATERSVYAYPVKKGTYQLYQMEVPNADPRKLSRRLFLSFSHSQVYGSRLKTIDWDQPPHELAPSQFSFTESLARVDGQHEMLELINDELSEIIGLHRQGRLSRTALLDGNLSLCRGLSGARTNVAENIVKQISELEVASTLRPGRSHYPATAPVPSHGDRAPASFAAPTYVPAAKAAR